MKKISAVLLSVLLVSAAGCDVVKNVANQILEIVRENPAPPPPPPPETPPPVVTPPLSIDAIDLTKVTWVHGKGQDIAAWPITAKLGKVEFKLPNVCSYDMDWPTTWTGYGAKNVTANHVVIAEINGKLVGGAWEAMYRGVAPCRVLEALRDGGILPDGVTPMGPFAQVEQSPFWDWQPVKGDEVCFIVTSWIRSSVIQPVGRSNAVCAVWP
jgi:hypothetical protein